MTKQNNIYLELTAEYNQGQLRAILTSGQAVVFYRLAIMSKDGDWIIREDAESLSHILRVLNKYNAVYRFGAPLEVRWLAAGWSSHFEFMHNGRRIRTDFFSRPPRISQSDLQEIWDSSSSLDVPVTDKLSLIKIKQTDRLKDYAVIGELCRLLPDHEQLKYSQSASDIISIIKRNPEALSHAMLARPFLNNNLSEDQLAAAIDGERRILMKKNFERITKYRNASNLFAGQWETIRKRIEGMPLVAAHAIMVAEAEKHLPTEVKQ